MPTIDYGKLLGDLKDAVLGTVKDQAKDFLDQNQDAKAFLEDRAKRLEELGVEYAKAKAAGNDTDQVSTQMSVVLQSIRNELAGIAVQAEAQARATFGKILETALGVMVKAIPVILAAV
jgi:hypothetical protein